MRIEDGINPSDRERAAEIYWAAFNDKLGRILDTKEKAVPYFVRTFVSEQAISVYDGNELIGIAGYDIGQGGIVGGGFWDLWVVYGPTAFWRAFMLLFFSRLPNPSTLFVDGIAVAKEKRGKGAGTALLHALYQKAEELERKSVTLEVINTNPRARELYAREGFHSVSEKSIGWLSSVLNFQSVERMVKTVGE